MRRSAPKPSGATVWVVRVDSPRLVTISPEHSCWTNDADMHECVDAFVRISPPAECGDVLLGLVADAARAAGARQVRVLAPARGKTIVASATPVVSLGHRAVVLALVGEARCAKPDELRALVGEVMDSVGL